jgi:cytochrome c biogenesis protein CcmG, thiol:disulfide interchange protein DsbE
MTDTTRDWLVTGAALAAVVALIGIGWERRERVQPPERGVAAPDFAAPTLGGDSLRLSELRGRVVLLNFWATWCPPCLREMPSMERLYRALAGAGLEIVAISLDARPGERDAMGQLGGDVGAFAREHGLTFPILLDPAGESQWIYGVQGLPTTFLIDRNGMIREKVLGGREWDEGEAAELVYRLIRNDP